MIIYILFVWIANIIIFLSLPRNLFSAYVLSPIRSPSVLYRKYYLRIKLTITEKNLVIPESDSVSP